MRRRTPKSIANPFAGLMTGHPMASNLMPANPMAAWSAWWDAARFAMDVQTVIALRLARIAAGGAAGSLEAERMVSEKLTAGAAAHAAATTALLAGHGPHAAMAAAERPIRAAVKANRRRLGRG